MHVIFIVDNAALPIRREISNKKIKTSLSRIHLRITFANYLLFKFYFDIISITNTFFLIYM